MPDFAPGLHPRDREGRWRDALRAIERDVPYGRPHRAGDVPAAEVAALRHLRPGETVVLPHGTALRRPFTDLRDPREFSVDLEGSPGRPSLHNASLGAELADAEREHREAQRALAATAFEPNGRRAAQASAERARRRLDAARAGVDRALTSNARAGLAASPASPGRPPISEEERRSRIRAAQAGPKPPTVGDIFTAIDQAVEVVRARAEGREPARLHGAPPLSSPGRPEPPFPRGGVSIVSRGYRMGPYGSWEQAADQLLRERAEGSTSARAVGGLTARDELSPEQQRHLVELAARRALRAQEARLRDRERLLEFLDPLTLGLATGVAANALQSAIPALRRRRERRRERSPGRPTLSLGGTSTIQVRAHQQDGHVVRAHLRHLRLHRKAEPAVKIVMS